MRFEGRHYQLRGANTGPVPAHPIEIWIGGIKPPMLALIGRMADGWIPSSSFVPPGNLQEMNYRIDDAAARAGRDPGKIHRFYNVVGRITNGERGGYLEGPVAYWADQLDRLIHEHGMDGVIFAPLEPTEDQIRLLPNRSSHAGEQIPPECSLAYGSIFRKLSSGNFSE